MRAAVAGFVSVRLACARWKMEKEAKWQKLEESYEQKKVKVFGIAAVV
ncbi:hypothetical protein [Bradyrhizobium sp. ISRA463]|nr:hypothetical protein [Bradyrhizobium sp. ISRA463]WGS21784.1 hypothetical protein MTX22_08870 [Bradyrhizobium sp. ISRA463]